MFFSKYERPSDDEADKVTRIFPDGYKTLAIYSDLDGTLCDCEHRRHFVRPDVDPATVVDPAAPKFKKDWKNFFRNMSYDPVVEPVMQTLRLFAANDYAIVYATGRPDNWKRETKEWLVSNGAPHGDVFMRRRDDSRDDDIVKEIILDFEILTRYKILFCLDDRDQVVKMLRSRGLTVFQVADGDF